jgi:RHS repeat-associated protein
MGFKPWGEQRFGASPTQYQYTGQYREQSLGIDFFNARWYDPALGRFLSADSLVPAPGYPGDFDRYAFVRNNLIVNIDPSGYRTCRPEEIASGDETCDENYPANDIDYVIHLVMMGTLILSKGRHELEPWMENMQPAKSVFDTIIRAITLLSFILEKYTKPSSIPNLFVWFSWREYKDGSTSISEMAINNYSDKEIKLMHVNFKTDAQLGSDFNFVFLPETMGSKSDYLATVPAKSSYNVLFHRGYPYICEPPRFPRYLSVRIAAYFLIFTNVGVAFPIMNYIIPSAIMR